MAKKAQTIRPRTMRNLGFCAGCFVVAISGTVALALGIVPSEFKIGVLMLSILTGLVGLFFLYMVIVPSRLILTDQYLIVKTITGNIRAQIPFKNIAQVRLHSYGEGDQEITVVGIDIVKRKDEDTWWPASFKGSEYDVELRDDWVKPPRAIAKLIQNQLDRLYSGAGNRKK